VQGSLTRFGRYEVRTVIGDGAMGRVYEAWDPLLSRRVAVKSVKAEYLSEKAVSEYLRRFSREAQAAGALDHPAVVKVFDVGPDYIVMERLEGPTLKELLERRQGLLPDEVVRILTPVADALDHAHRTGVVHRDVKPANIILQPDGTPKLMDFGVAWVASSLASTEGEVVGSPCYMAPEQIVGAEAGGAADVYALSVVAYEMLAGRPPFVGTVTQVIYKVVHEKAPRIREQNPALPARYDEVFERALDKDPTRRYATAAEVVAALAQCAADDHSGAKVVPAAADTAPLSEVETVAWPRRGGWYEHVETVAWKRVAAGGSRVRASPRLLLLALALAVAGASSRLGRQPAPDVRQVQGPVAAGAPTHLAATTALSGASPAARSAGSATAAQPGSSLQGPIRRPPLAAPAVPPGAAVPAAANPPSTLPARRRTAEGGRRDQHPAPQPATPTPAPAITVVAVAVAPVVPASPQAASPQQGADSEPTTRPAQRGELVELGPGVTPPRRLEGSSTVLPLGENGRPLHGTVGISMLVDEDGIPRELEVTEPASPALDRAALESARSWRYAPARKDGVPVRVRWMERQTYR
jgi:serine/threonine-protein kinase